MLRCLRGYFRFCSCLSSVAKAGSEVFTSTAAVSPAHLPPQLSNTPQSVHKRPGTTGGNRLNRCCRSRLLLLRPVRRHKTERVVFAQLRSASCGLEYRGAGLPGSVYMRSAAGRMLGGKTCNPGGYMSIEPRYLARVCCSEGCGTSYNNPGQRPLLLKPRWGLLTVAMDFLAKKALSHKVCGSYCLDPVYIRRSHRP